MAGESEEQPPNVALLSLTIKNTLDLDRWESMRKRMIDPNFWSDEKVGNLSAQARLLFIASWNLADDEGILPLRPEYLKSTVFMYDNYGISQVAKYLKELVDLNLLKPYKVNGQSYGIVVNFLKHQVINKPQPSKLPKPLPEDYGNGVVAVSPKRREENIREDKRIEENKVTNVTYGKPEINQLIEVLEELKGDTTRIEQQRFSANRLITKHGIDRVIKVFRWALSLRGTQYAPVITSIVDLERKWADLEAFAVRQKQEGKKYVSITTD